MVETGRDAVMEIPALKWPEIKRARFRYLGNDSGHKVDWLTVLFVEDCPAVYAAVDDDLGIRYDPETGNVTGVEIKGFEDSFLCQQLSDLAAEWAALKPDAPNGIHSSGCFPAKPPSYWLAPSGMPSRGRQTARIGSPGSRNPKRNMSNMWILSWTAEQRSPLP